MKKDYSVTSLTGALIWAAAVALRRFMPLETGIVQLLLNVLPKFAAVWLIVGLVATFWPHAMKKELSPKGMYALIAAALALLLLYVIGRPLLTSSAVYAWDIVAAGASAGWLAVSHRLDTRAQPAVPSPAPDSPEEKK